MHLKFSGGVEPSITYLNYISNNAFKILWGGEPSNTELNYIVVHLKFSGGGEPSNSSSPSNPTGSFLPAKTSNNLQELTKSIQV